MTTDATLLYDTECASIKDGADDPSYTLFETRAFSVEYMTAGKRP